MKSLYKWKEENPTGYSLTCTGSGGAGTAKVIGNQIIVDFTNTSTTATYTIDTPFSFQVISAKCIAVTSATGTVIYVDNPTTAITDDIGPSTDKVVKTSASIDDAQYAFNTGDDDLVITASSTATAACADAIVIIDILPT